MSFVWILFLAVGLSMDAFAVSVCRGLCMKTFDIKQALLSSFFFGFFQGGMPLIGFFAGIQFSVYIVDYDHWLAFAILAFIGINMIRESRSEDEDKLQCDRNSDMKELLILSVATSIDALAVGLSFSFIKCDIWLSVITIAAVTFVISFAGVKAGSVFGAKYKSKAEAAGGVILICIGIKILLEHLGMINF